MSSSRRNTLSRQTDRRTRHTMGRWRRAAAALLGIVLLATLAACSSSADPSQATNYTLILDGSTADHPSAPPTIAPSGPGGTYAFVYDNQIWLRRDGDTSAQQLTHIELSNGATLIWGPLVWSHSGKYIAFVLVQDLNLDPGTPARSAGPLYYLNVNTGDVMVSGGTGSIYGHTYTWIGDSMLLYSSGSGLMLYTLGDPRVWQVRDIPTNPGNSGAPDYLFFGDVSAANGNIYYTRLDVKTLGQTGAIGSATLMKSRLGLGDTSPTPTTDDLVGRLPVGDAAAVATLGAVYTTPTGDFVSGTWQVRPNGGLVVQQVQAVDASSGMVTSSVCVAQYSSCDTKLFTKAAQQAVTVRPQLAVATGGKVAYTADGVYMQGSDDKKGDAGWMSAAAWSPDGQTLAVTQLVSAATDVGGVMRYQTNVVAYPAGQPGATLIAGASDLVWAPST